MKKNFRRRQRSVSLVYAHLVFCTKYRRKVFTPRVFEIVKKRFKTISMPLGFDIIALECDRDHLHIMIEYPPTLSLSNIVKRLKGASSRDVRRQNFPEVRSKLWGNHFWSPSYFVVSCGGAPLDVVKAYVDNQQSPNRYDKKPRDMKKAANAAISTSITSTTRTPNGPNQTYFEKEKAAFGRSPLSPE